jgi:hypothetical protein
LDDLDTKARFQLRTFILTETFVYRCPTCRHELRTEEPSTEEVATPHAGTLSLTIRRSVVTERRRPVTTEDPRSRSAALLLSPASTADAASSTSEPVRIPQRRRPREESIGTESESESDSRGESLVSGVRLLTALAPAEGEGSVRRSKRRRTSRVPMTSQDGSPM